MEDAQIIALYWARNEDAISETDRKYGPFCHGIAQRILRIREESEECVSDTYLQAWNNIPPQKPNAFRAWLGRITRNLAISRYRKAHAEKRGGGEMAIALEELQTCIPGQSNVEEITESREIVAVLDRFLEGLPEKERNIFLRRYWHVNSVKEIAAAYGAEQGQIAAQLFRTRNKLRAALEKEGIVL